ncbi:hypothetical protein ACGF5M_05805 [Gemmatimonadota bacterium]
MKILAINSSPSMGKGNAIRGGHRPARLRPARGDPPSQGRVGMLLGEQWGFLLALVASVPFWYSAVPLFIWDRDMGFRKKTVAYWVVTWGMFPAYGVVETGYCMVRLLAKE